MINQYRDSFQQAPAYDFSQGITPSRSGPRSQTRPAAMTAHPVTIDAMDTAPELPARVLAPSGMTAKLTVVSRQAAAVPRPNGWTRAAIATCGSGPRVDTQVAAHTPT